MGYARYGINNNSFQFRLVPGKTNDNFSNLSKKTYFKKKKNNPKKTIWGQSRGPFPQNLGKNEFPWKKGLCQFLDIPLSTIMKKK